MLRVVVAALLHRAAAPADAEAVARQRQTGERHRLPAGAQAPEVHLAERRRLDVLEAERRVRAGHGIGKLDGRGLDVGHELPRVEQQRSTSPTRVMRTTRRRWLPRFTRIEQPPTRRRLHGFPDDPQ